MSEILFQVSVDYSGCVEIRIEWNIVSSVCYYSGCVESYSWEERYDKDRGRVGHCDIFNRFDKHWVRIRVKYFYMIVLGRKVMMKLSLLIKLENSISFKNSNTWEWL